MRRPVTSTPSSPAPLPEIEPRPTYLRPMAFLVSLVFGGSLKSTTSLWPPLQRRCFRQSLVFDPCSIAATCTADVTVDKDAATPLGLILNEVSSNCFKHAFPDGKAGTVTVSLTRVSGDRVVLSVEDDGAGFNAALPAKGIGRKLVAGFAKQLGGDFTFSSPGGSKFVLIFPGR